METKVGKRSVGGHTATWSDDINTQAGATWSKRPTIEGSGEDLERHNALQWNKDAVEKEDEVRRRILVCGIFSVELVHSCRSVSLQR